LIYIIKILDKSCRFSNGDILDRIYLVLQLLFQSVELFCQIANNSLVNLVYNMQLIATQGFLSANYNMDLY